MKSFSLRLSISAGLLLSASLCDDVVLADDSIQFQPRVDEHSASDLKKLRWALSQLKDENGKPDPLADYVPKPSTQEEREKRSHWKEDDEAHAKPQLFKNRNDYSSPNLQPSSIGQTPPISGPVSPASAIVPTQRVVVQPIVDPCYVPLYARMPLKTAYVSSNMPGVGMDRSALQPNVPTGMLNQNNSVLPGIPNTSVLPSGQPLGPIGAQPINPPLGGVGGNSVMPGSAGNPLTTPNQPFANPSGGGAIPIVPSPSGYTNTPATGVPTYPAPPPTYNNPTYNPALSNPYGNSVAPPRYPTSEIVNSQPFVCGPVTTRDARYMVSANVYRQNVPSTTCGTQPYAPGPIASGASGSPFSYAPLAYTPSFNGVNSTYKPLFGFGQNVYLSQLGRGIFGQPVAYMPSQPLRNILRYLSP